MIVPSLEDKGALEWFWE